MKGSQSLARKTNQINVSAKMENQSVSMRFHIPGDECFTKLGLYNQCNLIENFSSAGLNMDYQVLGG
jgi:hypothetical protein